MDTGAGVMTDLLDMSQIAAAKMNAQDTSASRWFRSLETRRPIRPSLAASSRRIAPSPPPNGHRQQQTGADDDGIVAQPRIGRKTRHGLHIGAQHGLLK